MARMTDRKYRQQGYRKPDAEPRRPDPPVPRPPDAPRPGGMLGRRTVSRCDACGATLPVANSALEQCPSCRPGRRFECAEAVTERIADKNGRNQCALFSLRVAVERDATPDATRPSDIRRTFDNLFKK
jgi:hypothetical protein